MGDIKDLELIIRSRTPIVLIETLEERKALSICSALAVSVGKLVYSWSITQGLERIDMDFAGDNPAKEPIEVLRSIKATQVAAIYVLIDFHPYLDDSLNLRMVKEIALSSGETAHTLIFVSHHMDLKPDLRKLSARFELKLPDRYELVEIVKEEALDWSRQNNNQKVSTNKKTLDKLVLNLSGLSSTDARRLARKAIFNDGAITESDLPEVMKAKYELLDQGGLLSYEYETEQFTDIGGMANLKKWLRLRKAVFHDPETTDLPPPKGILLLGVQGCGKSLAAKAVAGVFAVPLLRLDFGALYDKYYGESEKNLRNSLQTAQVMFPCVLWIDELEKGLASGNNDDGVGRRILGTLLTWMADRKESVFLVATANDIESLPPELIRKGRFDEIFFVDLPNSSSRKDIFAIHLQKRKLDPLQVDLEQLANAADGFSGAEIEQAIVSALYSAYGSGEQLGTGLILEEIKSTRPLSVVMSEAVESLRLWAKTRTVMADGG